MPIIATHNKCEAYVFMYMANQQKQGIYTKTKKQQTLLEQLFEQEYTSLWSFAFSYIKDDSIADDLTQEAFIHLWESLNTFDNPVSAQVYLYRIVKNAALDHLRHNKVKDKSEQELNEWLHCTQNEPSDRKIVEEEVFGYMYDAIEKLPNQTRKILLLSLEGISNPDIANRLDISVNTLKTLKKKAYQQLREVLGEYRLALLDFIIFFKSKATSQFY